MNAFLRVNSAPSALVTTDEAKAQARITSTAEDTLIGDYVSAASAAIDGPFGMAGRAFASQTWDYVMDRFCNRFLLPLPGATSVSAISYYDADDGAQSLTAGDYYYITACDDGLIFEIKDNAQLPIANERADAVTITVAAGGSVPEHIKHAALLTVAAWFDAREMGEVPMAAQQLINIERQGWVGA